VIVTDTFDGEGAAAPKIWTLNLAATGKVTTPFGEVEPARRTHPAENHRPEMASHELASASAVIELPAAAAPYRFGFTPAFAPGDRTLTVLVTCDEPQQALIGNWAVSAWGGQLTTREERQHILRLRGTRFRVEVRMSRRGAAEQGWAVVGQ
jgi:hypothetical protein